MNKKKVTTSAFKRKQRADNIAGYLFMSPAIISFVLFIGLPIILCFVLSFFDYNLIQAPEFVGLKNFRKLLADPLAKISLINSFKFLLILVPEHVIGGLLLAFAVYNVRSRRVKNIYRNIIYFPTILTAASVAIAWGYIFATDTGVINYYVRQLGGSNIPWMTNKTVIYVTVALFSFWKFIGEAFLYFFVGLQNIPEGYYEAAKIDGATTFQIFRHITLPLLSSTIFFVLIMKVIGTFQIFVEPYILTGGGPGTATRTISLHIYEVAFQQMNTGYGCLLAVVVFLIVLVMTIIQFKGQKKWVTYDYE